MSIYAILNNNKVENIVVCDDETVVSLFTNYVKVTEDTLEAAVGMTYDDSVDKFIAAKPYESWILNSDFIWESPEGPNPNLLTKVWDEGTLSWIDR